MPFSWKARVSFYQSRVSLHLHVYKKNIKRNHRFLLNAICCHFNRKVHFTVDKWTVQSIYAIITGFRFLFLMIIANSASFVTCCMSINSADFLCQCIVHVLGIIFFCRFYFFLDFFWKKMVWWIVPTERFVYRVWDRVPNSKWTFVLFMEKN